MRNFIDRTKEDREFVEEIIGDLRSKFPNLSSHDLNIPYKNYHLLKEYQKITTLETVQIEQSSKSTCISFVQVVYSTNLGRDGSNTSTDILTLVTVRLPKDFGDLFIKNETFIDKVQEMFQKLELDLDNDSAFSRKFLVLAKDQTKAKELLNDRFRAILKESKDKYIRIEIHNGLLVMSNMKSAADESLYELIKLGLDISDIHF
jgi:hypothetical protein